MTARRSTRSSTRSSRSPRSSKFLDTPVKRYSRGMYVRLAFAVAAHLEPEILIVDEVLAVGDAQFQRKCLGQDGGGRASSGRTVLFVSHNMAGDPGPVHPGRAQQPGANVAFDGEVTETVNTYLASTAQGLLVAKCRAEPLTPALDLTRFEALSVMIASGGQLEFTMTVNAREKDRVAPPHAVRCIWCRKPAWRLSICAPLSSRAPSPQAPLPRSAARSTQVLLVEGEYRGGLGFSTDTHYEDRQGLADADRHPTSRQVGGLCRTRRKLFVRGGAQCGVGVLDGRRSGVAVCHLTPQLHVQLHHAAKLRRVRHKPPTWRDVG